MVPNCLAPHLEVIVNVLIDEDEAEHRPTQTPLIAALLKQHKLKQSLQELREEGRLLADLRRSQEWVW